MRSADALTAFDDHLRSLDLAVDDLDAARGFLEGVVNGSFVYEEDRPTIGATALGVTLADTVVELLAPTGDGVISRHVARWGDGIRSTVFQVKDLEVAGEQMPNVVSWLRDSRSGR